MLILNVTIFMLAYVQPQALGMQVGVILIVDVRIFEAFQVLCGGHPICNTGFFVYFMPLTLSLVHII